MPAYSFEALDAQGETRKGVMEADTAKHIRILQFIKRNARRRRPW